jgi:eukaryotic-like serine/threonine-protein kinase
MFTINSVRAHLVLEKWKNIGGEGRNSKVWTALDKQLDEVVVLKEITKKSLDQQKVLDYFLESKMLNEANHPHVMPVRYAAEDDDNIYITMPFYNNGSINKKIEHKMLSVREIVKYSLDFLNGLMFIHIKGLLHLDIKPTNIVINDFDRAVITDFGLSRYLDENGFASQPLLYRYHRSPESLETEERTVLDDIYQAGLTMYRMAYGNQTFHSQFEFLMHQHAGDLSKVFPYIKKGDFPNRSHSLPHISNRLRKIIIKAMHHNPDRRYQTVLDLINDLAKVEELLDWEFSVNTDNSEFCWSIVKEKSIIEINLEQQNADWLVSGRKAIKRSGKSQNISMANGNFSTLDLAFTHVGTLLSHFD